MKRAKRKTKLIVGAFVVAAGMALSAAILLMSDNLSMFKTKTTFRARFTNAEGLHVGSPVKLGGVEIGLVDGIAVDVDGETPDVRADVILMAPYEKLVRDDSALRLETQGVLGDKFLVLLPGTGAGKRLGPGMEIPVLKQTELAAVVSKSTDILESVRAVAERLEKVSAGLPSDKELASMFADFSAAAKSLRTLVADPGRAKKIDAAVASFADSAEHLASITKKVDVGTGTLGALVNDAQVYDDVRTLLGKANRSKAIRFVVKQALEGESEPAH